MKKYFKLDTIKDALENLRDIDNKWLIIPLVLAANGVTKSKPVICNKTKGTGKYIELFFDGRLIGLEPREHGKKCNIRPGNPDPRRDNEKLITVDYSDLWGKTYSQSGYAAWQDGEILCRKSQNGEFQLGPEFESTFRSRISSNFKFESLLVWLYAFRGLPENITSWNDLLKDFENEYTEDGIPSEYKSVFSLNHTEAWPTEFLTNRPTDEEFQNSIIPELSSIALEPSSIIELRDSLEILISENYIGLIDAEKTNIANSIISGLQSCRRIFLYGDPGTGKTELARLIGAAFKNTFGDDRVHIVFIPIADSTSSDKLIGFSTLDGSWIYGALTQPNGKPLKKLLYSEKEMSEQINSRRQINLIILDEANRRDIEELLVKFQAALDSESTDPDHDDFCIALDNSGEQKISPNTFLVMTGNSPREDSGRVVQSRPFKRRKNLLPIENVFRRILNSPPSIFINTLTELWGKVGLALRVDIVQREKFSEELNDTKNTETIQHAIQILGVLDKHAIGVSFGLIKKLIKTAGMRYALTDDFTNSIDHGITESIFPLLSAEELIDGRSLKESLEELPATCKSTFKTFFNTAEFLLKFPDNLGRVRPFL